MTNRPTDAQVIDWLQANDRKYRRCAKHFGIPYATVREIWDRRESVSSSQGARTRARGNSANAPLVELSEVQRVEKLITETESAMSAAVDREQHSDKYLAILRGLSKDLAVANEKARIAGQSGQTTDPAAILEQLPLLIADAPEQVIEMLQEAISKRRGPALRAL